MNGTGQNRPWPAVLDRVLEVMRHFYCQDPQELETLLQIGPGSLSRLFRGREESLPPEVLEALVRAGVRSAYLLRGEAPMLDERLDRDRLALLRRLALRLLILTAEAGPELGHGAAAAAEARQVTDSQGEPVSLDEELASLLAEALRDRGLRERLLEFIRNETSNRRTPRR